MAGRISPPSAADAAQDGVRVEIKKESPEDEIKEYAETAMNELLGWYGYEKLDSRDTQGLDLHHFASVSKHARRHLSNRLPGHHHASPRGGHLPSSALAPHLPPPTLRPPPHRPTRHTVRTTLTRLPLPTLVLPPPAAAPPSPVAHPAAATHPPAAASQPTPPPPPPPTERHGDAEASPSSSSTSSSSSAAGGGVLMVGGSEVRSPLAKVKRECPDSPPAPPANSSGSRDDTGTDAADAKYAAASSSPSSSESPRSPEPHAGAESQPPLLCSWCGRSAGNLPITAPSTTTTLSLRNGASSSVTSTTTKAFCSEVCFTQCRRASFKRSKACDWCRHVRHTVAYVDFQDGETQLQFCSDKCLNQYKMNIFCKETQAHLAQLKAEASGVASVIAGTSGSGAGGGGPPLIITPDLWLRDCREHAEGEEGEGGRDEASGESHEEEEGEEEGIHEEGGMVAEEEEEETEGSPQRPPLQKRSPLVTEDLAMASKCPEQKASSKERPERRRKKRRRHSEDIPPSTPSTAAAVLFQKMRPPLGVQPPTQRMPGPRKTPPPLTHHPAPPSGLIPHPMGPSPFLPPHLPPHLPSPQIPLHLLPQIPEAHFSRFLRPQCPQSESMPPPHVLPPSHSSLSHPHPLPRVPPLQLPPQQPPSLLPPVTMLVPYPIILPIPVPIPIPIPVLGSALLKRIAEEKKKECRVMGAEAAKEEQEAEGNLSPSAPLSPCSSSLLPDVPSPHPLHAPDAPPHERSLSERKRSRGPSVSVTEEEGPAMGNKRKFVPA